VAGVWILNRAVSPAPPEMALDDRPQRKARIVRDRLRDVLDRFSIVIDGPAVTIVDGIGRVTKLRADGQRQPRVTGDGAFTSTTRFDGHALVVEDNLEGPRVITTYEAAIVGDTRQLTVTVRAEGVTRFRFGKPVGREALEPRVSIYDADPSIVP
jgi:hypothetical protein